MATDDVDDQELAELLDSALQDFDKLPEVKKPQESADKTTRQSSAASTNVAATGDSAAAAETKKPFRSKTGKQSSASTSSSVGGAAQGNVDFDQEAIKLAEMFSASFNPDTSDEDGGFDEENLEKLLAMMQSSLGDLMSSQGDQPSSTHQSTTASTDSPPQQTGTGSTSGVDTSPLLSCLEALSSSLPHFPDADTLLNSGGDANEEALLGAMLGPLLSREVVYTPLKELCDAYPGWLANQPECSEKVGRIRQCQLLREVCAEYEAVESGSNDGQLPVDRVRKVAGLLEEAMKMGPPPAELTDTGVAADPPPDCKGM